MTAIAGLWRPDRGADAAALCARMLSAQRVYGPHDVRQWSEHGFALGRSLFKILPEDAFDRQPLVSDGLALVADVRLDNRDELGRLLRWPEERCRTSSDSAILFGLLADFGLSALDELVGEFAFALWDRRSLTLTLARDPLGQRPLHFHRSDRGVAFATMPKGLHALPDVPYGPDEDFLVDFVSLLPHEGTRTFFKDVERVPPGHIVRVRASKVDVERYWRPQRAPADGDGDHVAAVRHRLDAATAACLRGVETAACHLSGGFDSSGVTATTARQLASRAGRVVAYTAVPRAGFDGSAFAGRIVDEGPLAAATAARYDNIEHVLVPASGRSPLEGLEKAFHHLQRPPLNPCNWVWTTAILDDMRARGLRVLLHGQLGNYTFSHSGSEYLGELVRERRFATLLAEAARAAAQGKVSWRSLLAGALGPSLPDWAWRSVLRLRGRRSPDLFDSTALNPRAVPAETSATLTKRFRRIGRPVADGFDLRLWALGRVDLGTYNKGILGGWGIELRDPTADRRLLEYCLRIPAQAYWGGGRLRQVARRALEDRVPAPVLQETRKGLQAADWFEAAGRARGELLAEVRQAQQCPPAARLLDTQRLEALVTNWPADWRSPSLQTSYRGAVLRGVAAAQFLRRASGSNAGGTDAE